MNIRQPYSILTLLPYSENSELLNRHQKLDDLYLIKSIVEMSVFALEGFINDNLTLFDAQVGENLCQIRACKTIALANKYSKSLLLKSELLKDANIIKEYKNKLEAVIVQWEDLIGHASSYDKSLDAREHIDIFINRHGLYLDLSEDVVYIISCYFLTHFSIRDEGIPSAMNLNYISRELHISKYRAKRLTHRYQVIICKLGCDFIIEIAGNLPSESGYSAMLPHLYRLSDENRTVLPCYITSEVIFNHNIKENVPVLFIVNQIDHLERMAGDCIYFTLLGNKNEFGYTLVSPLDYLSQFCMVVYGEVQLDKSDLNNSVRHYIDFVLTETPLKLILANTASHPQYSGKLLAEFKENSYLILGSENELNYKNYHEEKLINMQQFARKNGCSKDRPTTFLLKYVYATRTKDEFNKLNEQYAGRLFNASELI
jgi:hypothetical protein